jgi:aminoglycoside phosphotransferase (APT) family kinase protein
MWKEADGTLFLVMERLRGKTLESLWPTLQEPDKDRILVQIGAILKRIRNLSHQDFLAQSIRAIFPITCFTGPTTPRTFQARSRPSVHSYKAWSRNRD